MSDAPAIRLVALIGPLSEQRQATHTTGFPLDPEKMLPVPDVVLLIAGDDPGAMLYRYTVHGDFGGDTWHETVGDARQQAAFEYEDALMPWMEVPRDVDDAHHFAIRYAADQLNDRGDWSV